MEHDRSGSTSLNPVEDGGIYQIRDCGRNTPSSSIPGVVGGLVPRTESVVLGGLPFGSDPIPGDDFLRHYIIGMFFWGIFRFT